ncbi:MAG: hypothetical protein WBM08_07565 [Prochlorococcaceae cyanobacterium]
MQSSELVLAISPGDFPPLEKRHGRLRPLGGNLDHWYAFNLSTDQSQPSP